MLLNNKLKKSLQNLSIASVLTTSLFVSANTFADEFVIDTKGSHASIQFKISHLGYSWLWGRFNDFKGTFSYDEKNTAASKIAITVNTSSVDSNHAERDKHLRSDDFLDVAKYPEAQFVSTKYIENNDGKATLTGKLTLHGITKDVNIEIIKIGAGKDPWGGYRRGFEGKTQIKLSDYKIKKNLGPASAELELIINFEGVKQ